MSISNERSNFIGPFADLPHCRAAMVEARHPSLLSLGLSFRLQTELDASLMRPNTDVAKSLVGREIPYAT